MVSHHSIDVGGVLEMEANCADRDEENFVVHFVPVSWRAVCVRWDDELHASYTIIWDAVSKTDETCY